MSTYHTYYLARRMRATGMVSPSAPFDESGHMMCLMSRSRSFASDLWSVMDALPESQMDDALKREFTYTDWTGEETIASLRVMALSEMSATDPFMRGYVPAQDLIDARIDDDFHEYADVLDEARFAAFCMAYSRNKRSRRVWIHDVESDDAKLCDLTPDDYCFHMWVDRTSRQYDMWVLKRTAEDLGDLFWSTRDGYELVVVECEG